MATNLDYRVLEGAPGTAVVVKAVLENLRLHDAVWFASQILAVEPTLADVEVLLDRFAKASPRTLGFIWEMSWETMEWEEDEALFFEAAGIFELVGIAMWRADRAVPGESWDESRVRKGGRNPFNCSAGPEVGTFAA